MYLPRYLIWTSKYRKIDNHVCVHMYFSDAPTFRNLMLLCIGIGSLTSLGYHVLTKLPPRDYDQMNERLGQNLNLNLISFRIPILSWFKEYQLYQIALVYMSTRTFVNISQAYIPLYLQTTLRMEAKYIAIVPLTMFLSGFVISFTMKKVNDILGRKVTFIIGGVVGMYFTDSHP